MKTLVKTFSEINTEMGFTFTRDGVSLQALDSSHVSMMDMFLHSSFFEAYSYCCESAEKEGDEEQPRTEIGFSTKSLDKIFSTTRGFQYCEIRVADKAQDHIDVTFFNGAADGAIGRDGTRGSLDEQITFTVKMVNTEIDSMAIPETEYQCTFSMHSPTFREKISLFRNFSDVITVTADADADSGYLVFQGKDQETYTEIKNVIRPSTLNGGSLTELVRNMKIAESGDASASASRVSVSLALRYLIKFTTPFSLCDYLTISISPDYPALFEYTFPNRTGSLKFFLAPKMEEDWEDGGD
jgi:proliferating cell nuclear antigen